VDVFVIVNEPEPAQPVPPVSPQLPVIEVHVTLPDESLVPVAVPFSERLFPPDCTLNVKVAAGVVPVEVTLNDPLVESPVSGKHGPVVRKLK
jgi:hypothetical protein